MNDRMDDSLLGRVGCRETATSMSRRRVTGPIRRHWRRNELWEHTAEQRWHCSLGRVHIHWDGGTTNVPLARSWMGADVPRIVTLSPFAPTSVCSSLIVNVTWVGSRSLCEVTTPIPLDVRRPTCVPVPVPVSLKQTG